MAKAKKVGLKLVIEMSEDGVPHFDFVGGWAGKDIELISRLFVREYHKHQRSVRRTSTPTKEEK